MRALQFITDHVIFKLHYNQIYQMKTTKDSLCLREVHLKKRKPILNYIQDITCT